ncbi:MAG: heat-inducible transcription repressor HrcA [Clostridia bacterium]|nr:heat-inducible transcription repressor HrcA [Clostridia bacterium]
MELSERKKKILQYVIDDYIQTAVPVSSKSITEKHLTTVSSATVRSELSTLEELGYLLQPHTSSGRVPSNEAYKLYVNELMVKEKLSERELEYIEEAFLNRSKNIDVILKSAAKVISELTQYTSVALSARDSEEVVRTVKILRFRENEALLIIVTDNKLLKDSIITLPDGMTDDAVEELNELINELISGKTFGEVGKIDLDKSLREFTEYKEVFISVIRALKEYISTGGEVVLEGEDKMFSHPEYSDIESVKSLMSVVTSKDKLVELMSDDGKDIQINIKIGTEGYDDLPSDCSVVTATYSTNGVKIGTYGVIGPTRMDYKKVISVLENVGKILESIVSKW